MNSFRSGIDSFRSGMNSFRNRFFHSEFEDGVPLSCQDEHRALGDEDPDSGVSEEEGLGDRGTASISLKSSSGLHCGQEDSGGLLGFISP